jgi:hypothetical protein
LRSKQFDYSTTDSTAVKKNSMSLSSRRRFEPYIFNLGYSLISNSRTLQEFDREVGKMSPYNFFLCLSTMILAISFMGFLFTAQPYARFHADTYTIKINNLVGAEIGGTLGLMIKDDNSSSKDNTHLNNHKNDSHPRNATYHRTSHQGSGK